MALPIPTCPIVIPTFSENRGSQFTDPVTKSVLTLPVTYDTLNVCDVTDGTKFTISMNINQAVNCQTIQAANVSVSGKVPPCARQSDIEVLLDEIRDQLKLSFPV